MRILCICILIVSTISCSNETIIHPQKKDIVETVYASGTIVSNNEYSVYALSSGTVVKKLVKEGDAISGNQILYIIKNDAQVTRLQAAQTNYNIAQANLSAQSSIITSLKLAMQSALIKVSNDSATYFRLKNLWNENIGTQNNLDAAYTQYLISKNDAQSATQKYYSTLNDLELLLRTAKSQLTDARTDLNNYIIRSETGGTVFQTFKELGESVKPNDIVALMGETSQRIIKLAVDQQDISKIKIGQHVLLKTDITGNTIYHAAVTKIYPLMNETDQTFRVDAVFNGTTAQPFIHSSVEANIIIQEKKNTLVIPQVAMIADDSVEVKQNGKIKTIGVKTGIRTLDETEILKGLDESSLVILP